MMMTTCSIGTAARGLPSIVGGVGSAAAVMGTSIGSAANALKTRGSLLRTATSCPTAGCSAVVVRRYPTARGATGMAAFCRNSSAHLSGSGHASHVERRGEGDVDGDRGGARGAVEAAAGA